MGKIKKNRLSVIRSLSLRKTIILYLCIALVFSFFTSPLIVKIASDVQTEIWTKYLGEDYYRANDILMNELFTYEYTLKIPRVNRAIMTDRDYFISEFCDFIQTWIILILAFLSSTIAVLLFYRHKIQIPLRILEEGSEKIAFNNLNFTIAYDRRDEMGRLSLAFEKMRAQLQENNRNMWRMLTEEKNLRAAIAHDIRAPLAVLQGYQEMLLEFVPQDAIDKDKLIEMLQSGMGQINRLKDFIETVRRMSKLEDREVILETIPTSALRGQFAATLLFLCKERGLTWSITEKTLPETISIDQTILSEVFDNIISNTIRFAKSTIKVVLCFEKGLLFFEVYDDGNGFQEDVSAVTSAYYHSSQGDNLDHFGLGLYISKLYCEKHGGRLLLGNRESGGAYVKAGFLPGQINRKKTV